jgi:hypothetical protein
MLARRGPARALLLFGALLGASAGACEGTEGTLLLRHHEAAAGAVAMAGSAGTAGAAGMAAGMAGVAGSTSGPGPYFVPGGDVRWFTDLNGAVDAQQAAEFFYLDAENQDAATLQALHDGGKHYLCYLSGGSLESFRADADQFPPETIGNALPNFPKEHWLDVRNATVRDLMTKRVQLLAAAGCDGVPPSSLAVHVADTGFSLTLDDALDYARWLAERIHAAGMSAGLTAPADMTSQLWPTFDFGLGIGCVEGSQCAEYGVFEAAQRPVLYIELGSKAQGPELCKSAQSLGFNALISDAAFAGNCVWCPDIL